MAYVTAHKAVYLLLLLTNLCLMFGDAANHPDSGLPIVINVAVLTANITAGILWAKRTSHAILIERALSVGRMTVIIIASTVLLGGLVTYSPLFLVLWSHVFDAAKTWLPTLWIACAFLLALELIYFKKVGKHPIPNSRAPQSQTVRGTLSATR